MALGIRTSVGVLTGDANPSGTPFLAPRFYGGSCCLGFCSLTCFTFVIVGTVPKSNKKIVERGKIDTPNTHTHESSLSWLGTDTSIKSGRELGLQ
jgi:hypothetical protein